jgi:hypothetical protein
VEDLLVRALSVAETLGLDVGAEVRYLIGLPRFVLHHRMRLVAVCGLLGSAAVAAGYFVIAERQLSAFYLTVDWREPIKLLVVSLVLFAPFLAVGIVLAAIFGARPEDIDRLCCADLVGAGLGCAAAVPLISWLIPPGSAMLVGVALPLRCVLAAFVIAPLGLALGAFMPIELRTVAATTEYRREFVAWAWAVNGFLSVISSMVSTIIAMKLGFETLMLVAVGVYAAGVASLLRIPAAEA